MSSVDVVVPCYRYGRYLRECVGSVLSQEGADVRVLIIDDASPDDSAEVAAAIAGEDSRVSFVHHKVNRGHIATYNEGNDWVSADYTLLLSADDYLLPGALLRATALMDTHPEVSFTFGKAQVLHEDGSTEIASTGIDAYDRPASIVVPGVEFIEASEAKNRVPTPTAVLRTEQLKRVGGYRPELPHTGDMEMWWRFAAQGPVGIIGECQAVYRRHAANMSLGYSQALSDLRERRGAIQWFLDGCGERLPDVPRTSERIWRALSREAVYFARVAFDNGDPEAADNLSAFAAEVYPAIRSWAPWLKLAVKRQIGPRAAARVKAVLQ